MTRKYQKPKRSRMISETKASGNIEADGESTSFAAGTLRNVLHRTWNQMRLVRDLKYIQQDGWKIVVSALTEQKF